jgi:hypothetical protein
MVIVPLALLGAALLAPPQHFTLGAVFEPARTGRGAAVAVTFTPLDPDVYVNEEPAPRLKLDPLQAVLVDKQGPASGKGLEWDPDTARYLDLSRPVRFAVALAPGASKGASTAKASVVYFYCSKREAWCRRGSAEVEVAVDVK